MYNNHNNEELSQYEKILVIMFRLYAQTGSSKFFRASDFQKEMFGIFVGYEATARMSELVGKYPKAFETRMNGRFREIKFRFEFAKEIYNYFPMDLAKHLVREKIIL